MPNGKPDPNCGECKGTGQIPLFTSSCVCDCVNRTEFKPVFGEAIKQIKNNFNDINFKLYEIPKVFIDPKTLYMFKELMSDSAIWDENQE